VGVGVPPPPPQAVSTRLALNIAPTTVRVIPILLKASTA
jgi:hypothetical protein